MQTRWWDITGNGPSGNHSGSGEIVLMIDGGVRRGTDDLKYLAPGADFVLDARYCSRLSQALTACHAIRRLAREMDRDMAMLDVCT